MAVGLIELRACLYIGAELIRLCRVKVSRLVEELFHSSPMGIGSADFPRGALHGQTLFASNKPIQRDTLQYRYTSVPNEATCKCDTLQSADI